MYRRILVPVSGGRTSDLGVERAIELARTAGARLCFFHVACDTERSGFAGTIDDFLSACRAADHAADALVARARRRADLAAVPCVVRLRDAPLACLPDLVAVEALAWRADVIVLGAGRRGAGGAGSDRIGDRIIEAAPVPVMAVG